MRLRNIPEAKGIVADSCHVLHIKEGENVSIPAMLGTDKPIHLEIGMGKGAFLIELALRHPENYYIGVERYESVLLRAVQKMDALQEQALKEMPEQNGQETTEQTGQKTTEQTGQKAPEEDRRFPDNLKFLCEDAANLPEYFPAGSVERLYLNFSDPWPKARHEKRRLTSHYFLSVYEQFMEKGGLLVFKTDNKDLFEFSVESVETAEHWTLQDVTRDLHHTLAEGEENVMTEYERKFSNLGSKICRLTARFD